MTMNWIRRPSTAGATSPGASAPATIPARARSPWLRDDYHKLLAYCKAKGVSFFKLQFPSIVVSYGMEGEKTVIDELKMVQISKRSNSVTQGDKSVKVSLDLAIYGGVVQDGVEPI